MELGLLGPVLGFLGIPLGVAGTLTVQRYGFKRTDAAVRRDMGTLLRLALEQIAPRSDTDADRSPQVWLPRFRECLKVAIERGRQLDVAAALTDEQHLAVRRAVERLQELLHLIASDIRDDAATTDYVENVPSDGEWFTFSGPIHEEIALVCVVVAHALIALGQRKFVEDTVPDSVRRVL